MQTRIKFTRLGHPGMNKPQDIILNGNASDDKIVVAIKEEGRKRYASSNIRLVKGDRMVQPDRLRAHPLEAFLGRSGVTDTYTREEEDAFEYVCRHTRCCAHAT